LYPTLAAKTKTRRGWGTQLYALPKAEADEESMETREILDHQFLVAAYAVTWILQLGYLAWLGAKWRAQKRASSKRH
jgi:CcmD family protein